MAENEFDQAPVENKELEVIDPIYQKFVKSIVRSLGSTDFYEFFMESISRAENEFQFSNRRLEKFVDTSWVEAIEAALKGFQNIVASPRNVIKEEELIVNVANARKAGSDVVRHLATHAALVENYDEETSDVRPGRLMQKYRDDTMGIYENRVVFTTLEDAYNFVKIRHDALFEAMSDEFGAKLKISSDMDSATETVHMDMFLHIKDSDSALEVDDKNRDILDRISRLYRILNAHMNSRFARHMRGRPRVSGPLIKTNVTKKDPNYKAIVKLWDFLGQYTDIGYTIRITEQNPVINETFERDIYHNILFNYLVLKGHLERDKDRTLPKPLKEKRRKLRPKFIKEIIEELTEDYDLPDVEVRKVLIEELTKEQLMLEEKEERRRLVEEQEQKRREEEERLRREKEEEKERLRLEKEAEKERIRREKEAEEARLKLERMLREQEMRRRSELFRKELEGFFSTLEEQLEARTASDAAKIAEETQDFVDAAYIVEETERLRLNEAKRARQRAREEAERKRREALLERERIEREAREEQERIEREAREEQERIEREAKEQLMREEAERIRIQHEADEAAVAPIRYALRSFDQMLAWGLEQRRIQALAEKEARERMEEERQRRLEARLNSERKSSGVRK